MKEIEARKRILYVVAGVAVVAGAAAITIGYLGIRNESNVALQMPYVLSGGITGVFLLGLGATLAFATWFLDLTRSQREVVNSIEELRVDTAALADRLEELLAGAELVVDGQASAVGSR
jgi:hypothetical protein